MAETIFSKIIRGEIPSYKVYEDDHTYAFLDIHPIQPGQVVVIPKKPAETVWDTTEDDYAALMQTARRIAKHLKLVFPEKKYIGMMIEGIEVAYAHIKMFPFDDAAEYSHKPSPSTDPSPEELARFAEKIKMEDN